MTNGLDRRSRIVDQTRVTGIDFVFVHENQVELDVHFLVSPGGLDDPLRGNDDPDRNLSIDQIRITLRDQADGPVSVPVTGMAWDEEMLRLTTEFPGGFSLYTLSIDDPRIDSYFNNVAFSFKAHCDSDLDCAPGGPQCPPEEEIDFPVDYRARDFWSLRRALLDFAAERYPDWQDRLAADAGIMLAEVMSALGDELAYYQDRVGREAYLETASQRRSLRRHTRLVDYEIHDGLAASTWLDVTVAEGDSGALPAGTDVWAEGDDGSRVHYEVGRGLEEIVAGKDYPVDSQRNAFDLHIWDEDDDCLPVGATEVYVRGALQEILGWDKATEPGEIRWVLLKTQPEDPAIPARRWLVRLTEVHELEDPLLGVEVTRLVWEEDQALPFQMDLRTLTVRANLVPVTAGRTFKYRFVVGSDPEEVELPDHLTVDEAWEARRTLTRAVEREGPNLGRESRRVFPVEEEEADGEEQTLQGRPTIYLFSEPDSLAKILDENGQRVREPILEMLLRNTPVAWRRDSSGEVKPEVRLAEMEWGVVDWVEVTGRPWEWRPSLLGSPSSLPTQRHFTLEDGTWRRVVGFHRRGREIVHRDYASGEGKTIRFGDNEFGRMPARGTVFELTCRLGNGRPTNVAADSLKHWWAPPGEDLSFIIEISNPLPATDGIDPEPADQVRQVAPDAFRAITYRAVRPRDYAEAAERLDWVQRAGAAFRWTGSWMTAFVTPDPVGAATLSERRRQDLADHIDRFRQAGRETYVSRPRYADIDLKINVCVAPDAYRGEVKERVLEVLLGRPGRRGFFSPDNFTFGTPLYRSRLEAAIQGVSGVRAVERMRIRRRGVFDWRPLTGPHVPVGDDEVIRLENDPDHPDRGTLTLNMEGGA